MPPVPNQRVIKGGRQRWKGHTQQSSGVASYRHSVYKTDNRARKTSFFEGPTSESSLKSDTYWLKTSKDSKNPLQALSKPKPLPKSTKKKFKNWSEWKGDTNTEVVTISVPGPTVRFETPRFDLSPEDTLPYLEPGTNEQNWREFKRLGGVCSESFRPRLHIIKSLVFISRDSSVTTLYNIQESVQCNICGIRFPLQERKTEFAKHLDHHYLTKTTMSFKNPWKIARWYPSIEAILKNDSQEESTPMEDGNDIQKEAEIRYLAVWEAPSRTCELCMEPFDQEFIQGEDKEGWYLVNAILTPHGRNTVHPGCQ